MNKYKKTSLRITIAFLFMAAFIYGMNSYTAAYADVQLHSFEKSERVPVEPNVLFFLDTSGSMLWPMDAGADERGPAKSTFGDGTLGWKQSKHKFLQEYYGRDVDNSNNDQDNPDHYHPLLKWQRGGAEKANDSDKPMPNDSRGYKAKLVLWRIFNDKSLISGMRIAFSTYMQTFTGADNTAADWYRYPHSKVSLNTDPDASPGRYGSSDGFNRFKKDDNGQYLDPVPDTSLGAASGYRNSWLVASGVLIGSNENSKRALLRADFRSYIDQNGLLLDQLLKEKLLKWMDGTEYYDTGQLTPTTYNKGDPEFRFDGWRPLKESLSAADKTSKLSGNENEGLREGSVANFFTMGYNTDGISNGNQPKVITDYCQGNWLILLTSGGQSYGTDDELVQSVKNLYNTTVTVNGEPSRNIRTVVLAFVDPTSNNPDVVALRKKLTRVADAGDNGKEDGSVTEKEVYFATDVPSIMNALRQILYYIKQQSSTSGAPLATPTKTAGGEDHYYQAKFLPKEGKQWEGDLVKYINKEDVFSKAWSAAEKLNELAWSDRTVYTAIHGHTSDLNNLVNFNVANGNSLGNLFGLGNNENAKEVIRWLLGKDEYDEDKDGSKEDEHHKLFDIYHSGIVKIGPPDASVNDSDYRDFLTTWRKRPTLLYVQSNSGMVHGINDLDGTERFAFIPPNVLFKGRLRGLKWDDIAKRYAPGTTFPRYLLDGPIIAEDVYVEGQYRTFILGLLGLGGAGLYAFDVTNPDSPSFQWAVENDIYHNIEEKIRKEKNLDVVFWGKNSGGTVDMASYPHTDFSDAQSQYDYRDLRFTVSTPFIGYVPLTTGKEWVFVMGNGTSRGIVDDGEVEVGSVFIGKMSNGQLLKKMTAEGARRFVSPVAVLNEGVRRKIRTFFIGDMAGRIYKGVLDGPDPSLWDNLSEIFRFSGSVGISYPLDAAYIKGKTWLFAGTGDIEGYLGDTASSNYFIAANISAGADEQSDLTALSPTDFAQISESTLGWSMGFASREKMSTPPVIYNGYVFFSTFIPDEDICTPKGVSRIYVLKADTGKGGWDPSGDGQDNPKFLALENIKVSGISVAGRKISLGVTKYSETLHPDFQALGDNMIVTEIPKDPAGRGGIPSGTLRPFYWKNR